MDCFALQLYRSKRHDIRPFASISFFYEPNCKMSASQASPLSPDYISEYSGGQLIAVAIAFIPIITIFVALRVYSRRLSKAEWGLDDYIVLVSFVIQIGASALAICFVKYGGVGRHLDALEQINPPIVTSYYKYLLAVSFYYFAMVGIPKLAILALYLRIFTIPLYRNLVYFLAFIVTATGIVCSVMTLNLCRPFPFNWDRKIPGGSCYNESLFYRWGSLPNIITDLAILIIPMPMVWKLHTSRNMKIGLTLTFLTGSIGLATSILRFDSFFKGSALEDGTWSSVDLMTWTLVEPDVYLIAACLPTYRPLLLDFLTKTHLLKKSTASGGSSGLQRPSRSLGSRNIEGNRKSSAGFKELKGSRESIEAVVGNLETADDIRLVNISKDDVERGLGPNQIRVRNDVYVEQEWR
ncbi:integral membrane protein [Rutstroemia sp. NJR-2017a BVV2]|nr:integral membrane protein [Rutstroemia sp. NJR-2017a BVV2]